MTDLKRSSTNLLTVSYRGSDKLFVQSLASYLILAILLLIDFVYHEQLMRSSIEYTVQLQTYRSLETPLRYISTIMNKMSYFYLFFLISVRKDFEKIALLIFASTMMFFFNGVVKMFYHEPRPYFLDERIIGFVGFKCDYGTPSGWTQKNFGLLLFFYWDAVTTYSLRKFKKRLIQFGLFVSAVVLLITQMFFGSSSFMQVLLGLSFGVSFFFLFQNLESRILQEFIWPIFYKDRFVNRNSIGLIFFTVIGCNFILIYLWAWLYTSFEDLSNPFFDFKNAKECLSGIDLNFSTKVLLDSPSFNFFFGMLIGIYIRPSTLFFHQGFYTDKSVFKFIARFFLNIVLVFPLWSYIYLPSSKYPFVELFRGIFENFLAGYLFTRYGRSWLKLWGLAPPLARTSMIDNVSKKVVIKEPVLDDIEEKSDSSRSAHVDDQNQNLEIKE